MARGLIPNSTQIPDIILDDWMPLLTGGETSLVMFIARKTFGWGKVMDRISLTQMEEGTGLSRPQVIKICKDLKSEGVLLIESTGDKLNQHKFGLNFNGEDILKTRRDNRLKKLTSKETELVKKLNRTSKETLPLTSKETLHTRNKERDTNKKQEDPPNPQGGVDGGEESTGTQVTKPQRVFPPSEPDVGNQPAHLLWRLEMSNKCLVLATAMSREAKAANELLKAGYTENEIIQAYEQQRGFKSAGYDLFRLRNDIPSLIGKLRNGNSGHTTKPAANPGRWAYAEQCERDRAAKRAAG